jgi:hypothetical protein
MTAFLLYALVLLAVHRIWHYEDIFAPARARLLQWVEPRPRLAWWSRPVTCVKCSPLWLGLGLALVWSWVPESLVFALAGYPVLRAAVAFYGGYTLLPMSPLDRARANMRPVGDLPCTTCPKGA